MNWPFIKSVVNQMWFRACHEEAVQRWATGRVSIRNKDAEHTELAEHTEQSISSTKLHRQGPAHPTEEPEALPKPREAPPQLHWRVWELSLSVGACLFQKMFQMVQKIHLQDKAQW